MLNQTSHRPGDLPPQPWIMSQSWGKALFSHWPVPVQLIRDLVLPDLEIDTFDNQAWLTTAAFEMSDIHLRGLPMLPLANRFSELNLRTYVIYQNKPGILFFSCDAAHRLAVAMARAIYYLPYLNAQMSLTQRGKEIRFTSQRTHRNVPSAQFDVQYRPTSDEFYAEKNSLDHWLMERYCLYATHQKKVYRTDVHHAPWPLQHVEAQFFQNTLAQASKISMPDDPPAVLHYAEKVKVQVWFRSGALN